MASAAACGIATFHPCTSMIARSASRAIRAMAWPQRRRCSVQQKRRGEPRGRSGWTTGAWQTGQVVCRRGVDASLCGYSGITPDPPGPFPACADTPAPARTPLPAPPATPAVYHSAGASARGCWGLVESNHDLWGCLIPQASTLRPWPLTSQGGNRAASRPRRLLAPALHSLPGWGGPAGSGHRLLPQPRATGGQHR